MTHKIRSLLFITVLLFSVVGCSSNPASLDRSKLSTNKISFINLTSPEELTYEQSATGVQAASAGLGFIGGLAGAIIDEGINSRRQRSMQAILKALGNYNVKTSLSNKLSKLSGNSFSDSLSINRKNGTTLTPVNGLGVKASYILSANHQYVTINASTYLQTSEEAEPYRRNFTERTKIQLNTEGERVNVTKFLIDNPQVLKTTIETALNSIVNKISYDINVGVKPKESS